MTQTTDSYSHPNMFSGFVIKLGSFIYECGTLNTSVRGLGFKKKIPEQGYNLHSKGFACVWYNLLLCGFQKENRLYLGGHN